MSYTIVRPGGMERPKDDFKASHNLVIKPRDSIFGGQVRRVVQGFLFCFQSGLRLLSGMMGLLRYCF